VAISLLGNSIGNIFNKARGKLDTAVPDEA